MFFIVLILEAKIILNSYQPYRRKREASLPIPSQLHPDSQRNGLIFLASNTFMTCTCFDNLINSRQAWTYYINSLTHAKYVQGST
jgi:hypothetical protein